MGGGVGHTPGGVLQPLPLEKRFVFAASGLAVEAEGELLAELATRANEAVCLEPTRPPS